MINTTHRVNFLLYGLNIIQIALLTLTSVLVVLAIYFKITNAYKHKERLLRKETEKEIFEETKKKRLSIGAAKVKFEDYYMISSPPRPLQKISPEFVKRAKEKRQEIQEKKAKKEKVLTVKQKKNRIPTGILELDYLLYGGLQKQYSISFLVPSCDEKELILAKIVQTAIDSDLNVIFATNKILPFYNLMIDHKTEKFNVVLCTSEQQQNERIVRCDEGVTSLNLAIAQILNKIKGESLIVIDNLSQLLLLDKTNVVSDFLKALGSKLKAKSSTLIAMLNAEMLQPQVVAQISEFFDCEIELYKREDLDKKFVRVNKLSGHTYKQEILQIKKDELVKSLKQ